MFKFLGFKKEAGKEKRVHARGKVFYLAKIQVPSISGEKKVLTSLKDLSANGVCVKLQEALPVSSILRLYINYPSSDKPYVIVCKIAWVRKHDKSKGYEAGLNFVEIEDALRQEIIRNIDFITKKPK